MRSPGSTVLSSVRAFFGRNQIPKWMQLGRVWVLIVRGPSPPPARSLCACPDIPWHCKHDTYLHIIDRPSIVPEAYAELSGIRSSHVKVSPEYGVGFIANVEGLHHLHCLVRDPITSRSHHMEIVPSLVFLCLPSDSPGSCLKAPFHLKDCIEPCISKSTKAQLFSYPVILTFRRI